MIQTYVYGTDADLPLLRWWAFLGSSGEIAEVMGASARSLGAFLKVLAPPNVIFYMEDAQGWWGVVTVAPFMAGMTWGCWLRADKRQSREALRFLADTLDFTLAQSPVVVNIARSEAVVAKSVKLGYTYIGAIPDLFDGETCHILYLTRDAFEAKKQKDWSRLWATAR